MRTLRRLGVCDVVDHGSQRRTPLVIRPSTACPGHRVPKEVASDAGTMRQVIGGDNSNGIGVKGTADGGTGVAHQHRPAAGFSAP